MPEQELSPTKIIPPEQQQSAKADFANLRRKGEDFIAAVQRVIQCRSWESLGYESLEAAWQAEWLDHGFKMTVPQMRKIAPALAEAGLPSRAIAAAAGVSPSTAQRAMKPRRRQPAPDLRPPQNDAVPTNPVDNSAVAPDGDHQATPAPASSASLDEENYFAQHAAAEVAQDVDTDAPASTSQPPDGAHSPGEDAACACCARVAELERELEAAQGVAVAHAQLTDEARKDALQARAQIRRLEAELEEARAGQPAQNGQPKCRHPVGSVEDDTCRACGADMSLAGSA